MSHCVAIHGHNGAAGHRIDGPGARIKSGFPRFRTRSRPGNFGLALFAPAGLGTGINRAFTDAFTQLRDAASAETILRKLVVRHRLINQHMISRVLAHLQKSQRRETLGLIAVHLRSIEGPVADAVAAVVRSAIPTMTIWGALDQINPPDRRRLNALGGEQHFLTEAGHLPQIEDYNTCNGLLQTFLEKHSQHTVAT